MAKRKMFLIDGSNHAFKAQFALPPQHASDGFPTRVLYGFTLLMQKVIKTYQPDYCAVAFDIGKTFRNEIFPEYKGHRPEMPADLRRQWPLLPELVRGFGITALAMPGWEADDVIGTLAAAYGSDEVEVYIVTSDKDFGQVVNENVRILNESKNELLDVAGVTEKMGVRPDQVIAMLGLSGDSADNIPGVPGVGDKTASSLLAQYETLEGVLEAAARGDVKGKRGQALVDHADAARLSATLATIRLDVPVGLSLEDLAPKGLQEEALRELFDRWEFGMVSRKLLPAKAAIEVEQYAAIVDQAGLDGLIAGVRASGTLAVEPLVNEAGLRGLGLCWGARQAAYLPLDGEGGLEIEAARAGLVSLLSDVSIKVLGQDIKQGLKVLRAAGFTVSGSLGDTHLLDYVLVAHRKQHELEDLAQRHLGHTIPASAGPPATLEEAVRRACEPANLIFVLHKRLLARLEPGPAKVYAEMELPLLPVLDAMETAGIRLDVSRMGEIQADILGRMAEAEAKCHELAGRVFQLGSPKEIGELLFEELGLPTSASKKLKTGWSTDSGVLERLDELHPLPSAILEWRMLQKLESTYLRKLPQYVAEDGRIHTTFQQAVAATGRLSSADPNLQNIPIRSFEGRRIRDAFIPAEGMVFLSCDYSQIELRVLAHTTGAPALVQAFRDGEDIHRRTASEVFEVPVEQVSSAQRSAAKAINFGLLYGMSAFRLGRELQIGTTEAQRYMDEYFGRMPQVQAWIEAVKRQCEEDGYVETLYGRRRLIPEITSKDRNERATGEREAVNTVVQGTAADLIKIAMISVHNALAGQGLKARILLQVHDELLLEVPEGELETVKALVVRLMKAAGELDVPLEVNAAVGQTWNQAHG